MERTTLEQVKKWIQHRIDYYETIVEKQPNILENSTNIEEKLKGFAQGEYIGLRDAFVMVMECIEGKRR